MNSVQNTPQPTPPQAPQIPPLTTGQKVKYSFFGLLFLAIIGFWIYWQVNATNADNDLKDNGIRVTGTASGDYFEFTDRSRRSSTTHYKAKYDYTQKDGIETNAIGEKVFKTIEEVEAIKGKTADVYYSEDATKGTYVENEP